MKPDHSAFVIDNVFFLFQGLIRHFRPLIEERMAEYKQKKTAANI